MPGETYRVVTEDTKNCKHHMTINDQYQALYTVRYKNGNWRTVTSSKSGP